MRSSVPLLLALALLAAAPLRAAETDEQALARIQKTWTTPKTGPASGWYVAHFQDCNGIWRTLATPRAEGLKVVALKADTALDTFELIDRGVQSVSAGAMVSKETTRTVKETRLSSYRLSLQFDAKDPAGGYVNVTRPGSSFYQYMGRIGDLTSSGSNEEQAAVWLVDPPEKVEDAGPSPLSELQNGFFSASNPGTLEHWYNAKVLEPTQQLGRMLLPWELELRAIGINDTKDLPSPSVAARQAVNGNFDDLYVLVRGLRQRMTKDFVPGYLAQTGLPEDRWTAFEGLFLLQRMAHAGSKEALAPFMEKVNAARRDPEANKSLVAVGRAEVRWQLQSYLDYAKNVKVAHDVMADGDFGAQLIAFMNARSKKTAAEGALDEELSNALTSASAGDDKDQAVASPKADPAETERQRQLKASAEHLRKAFGGD